eukprot:gene572-753_t
MSGRQRNASIGGLAKLAFVPSRMVEGFGLSAAAAGGVMVLYGIGGFAQARIDLEKVHPVLPFH